MGEAEQQRLRVVAGGGGAAAVADSKKAGDARGAEDAEESEDAKESKESEDAKEEGPSPMKPYMAQVQHGAGCTAAAGTAASRVGAVQGVVPHSHS